MIINLFVDNDNDHHGLTAHIQRISNMINEKWHFDGANMPS